MGSEMCIRDSYILKVFSDLTFIIIILHRVLSSKLWAIDGYSFYSIEPFVEAEVSEVHKQISKTLRVVFSKVRDSFILGLLKREQPPQL